MDNSLNKNNSALLNVDNNIVSPIANSKPVRFAFLVHPLSRQSLSLLELDPDASMLDDWSRGSLFNLIRHTHQAVRRRQISSSSPSQIHSDIKVIDTIEYKSSSVSAIGRLYEIPMSAVEILNEPDRALRYMEQAVVDAQSWGARLVGLGSLTAIVGNHGEYLAERSTVPITTGNSLTVYAALENFKRIIQEVGLDNRRLTIAVVGIPGSIASAIASQLSRLDYDLIVIARQPSARSERLAKQWNAKVQYNLTEAVQNADVVITATSSGGCIDSSMLKSGAVVLDVGVPADVLPEKQPRNDVLILSAGYSRVPKSTPGKSRIIRFFHGVIPSCLAETITLALDGTFINYSIGKELKQDRIEQIGLSAIRHGFDLAPLLSQGLEIESGRLVAIRKIIARTHRTGEKSSKSCFSPSLSQIDNDQYKYSLKSTGNDSSNLQNSPYIPSNQTVVRSESIYEKYMNPVLIKLSQDSNLLKTFVRGEGLYLYDSSGERYLDFVAGFGSMNHGHNHPTIVSSIQSALTTQSPGFIPSSVNPYTARLAEELITIAPDSLEMVFFTNSGAESVEAALKLARLVTGRSNFLACEKSYHGKTFGALSVTMNWKYQSPFQPLIPTVQSVDFNDLENLSNALRTKRFAAFIIEPIQGEGGMNVPSENYLKSAEALCRSTGTIFIVDEVQTGFGRTGKMFAVEHENVQPDIMTLAKSLSGGLIPIGAMLSRRDLWMKAYGTYQSFTLHTSTFSGGSLACAAGSAAIQVLLEEDLIDNARIQGDRLRNGLLNIARRTDRIKDVRGAGLMLGLELNPISDMMKRHNCKTNSESSMMIPGYDTMISSFPTVYLSAILLEKYRIYTQTARSNPNVLRIQPPLLIREDEVDYFLNAVESILLELDSVGSLLSSILTKSVGEIDKQ